MRIGVRPNAQRSPDRVAATCHIFVLPNCQGSVLWRTTRISSSGARAISSSPSTGRYARTRSNVDAPWDFSDMVSFCTVILGVMR